VDPCFKQTDASEDDKSGKSFEFCSSQVPAVWASIGMLPFSDQMLWMGLFVNQEMMIQMELSFGFFIVKLWCTW
jgi:hypothetical protein